MVIDIRGVILWIIKNKVPFTQFIPLLSFDNNLKKY